MSQIDPLRHAGYIQNQLKTPGRLEAFMNRLVLFAVLLFQSSLIFCQSTAIPARSAQVPGKVSMGQGPFRFSNGQPGQNTARRTFKSFDCHSPNATQNQANVPIDFDHLFNAPYMDLKSRVDLFALNENSSSWSPLVIGPHPRGEPIPTQWPHAKIERIPTQWPNLKLQPVDGISPGVVPVQGSAK
jgi:hypothetical protein